jgi:hypothetical protein
MPESLEERATELADQIRRALADKLAKYSEDLDTLRDVLAGQVDVTAVSDGDLREAVSAALAPPPSPEEQRSGCVPGIRWICWSPSGCTCSGIPSAITMRTRPAD